LILPFDVALVQIAFIIRGENKELVDYYQEISSLLNNPKIVVKNQTMDRHGLRPEITSQLYNRLIMITPHQVSNITNLNPANKSFDYTQEGYTIKEVEPLKFKKGEGIDNFFKQVAIIKDKNAKYDNNAIG
ncbi:35795_t:CDS:2, partial [Gigaspora margarita]